MDKNKILAVKLYRDDYDKALADHLIQVAECVSNKRIYEEDLEALDLDFSKPILVTCNASGEAFVYSSNSKKLIAVDYNLRRNKGDIENYDFEVWLSKLDTDHKDLYVDLGNDISMFKNKLEEINHVVLGQFEDETLDSFIMYYTLAYCEEKEKPANNIKIPDIYNSRLNDIMNSYIKVIEREDNCVYYTDNAYENGIDINIDMENDCEKIKAIFMNATGSVFTYSERYKRFVYIQQVDISFAENDNLVLAVIEPFPVTEYVDGEIMKELLNHDKCKETINMINEILYRRSSIGNALAICIAGYHFFE